ncbi:MAG: hypothetical protein H0X24_21670 [Ktedonobacterales bacterium]|nr:hypothetical protein [Ktedonobacterales bacterium]
MSDASDINLFGEVLTCHLQDATTNPSYAHLRSDVDAYIATYPQYHDFVDPWPFLYTLHPEYLGGGMKVVGAYSKDIVMHHPVQFLGCILPTIGASWLATPVHYAGPVPAPLARPFNTLAQWTLLGAYLPLPVLLGAFCWATWRRMTGHVPSSPLWL